MGMGYSACNADTISEDFIREIAPDELTRFLAALEKEGSTLEEFAQEYTTVEDGDLGDEVLKTFHGLCVKFSESCGLYLGIGFHNSKEDGSRYDDVDGAFWTVDGVLQYTPAGQKYKERIVPASWVVFG